MDPSNTTKEDPLIAALPPATDYITYLTLLEYQLRPDNLSTLNGLLSDDDGTLAAEIGWDLLKLVLPMIQIVPEEANKCLSIIARRGNPREVVVRVAEELERLGESEDEGEEDTLDDDGLPTFAGEAPRIHLGEMKLDGMPPPKEESETPEVIEPVRDDRRASLAGQHGSDDVLILQGLLSMLGNLHPRIKTQYPSRFLATSLPAALRAYRRLGITTETTAAFVHLLSKLSGKQRPLLPPRASTASGIPPTTTQAQSESDNVRQAPLPDPEATSDLLPNDTTAQANERAITRRLLQAVMLEVLDEYTASFQTTDQPSMSWTVRLREKHEPRRVLPNRPTETQRWVQSPQLKPRDETIAKFLKLSKDLDLEIALEIHRFNDPIDEGTALVEQPESDYPTLPSQIPFPTSGLILLFAAQNFAQDVTDLTSSPPLSLSEVQTIFRATFAPVQEITHPPSLSQTDALLSLIYLTLQSPLSQPAPQPMATTTTSPSSTIDLAFLTNLTNLFITSPDPQVRDSTHHITTLLLHNHTNSETKLLYIKSLLSPHLSPASPIHDIQQGNIHALAINWLKDEFLSYHTTAQPEPPQTSTGTDAAPSSTIPVQPPILQPVQSPTNPGLDPNLMHTDPDLTNLIYPQLPTTPSPFITGQPAASDTPILTAEPDLETLLLRIPSYIAALNLTCILSSLPYDEHDSVLAATTDGPGALLENVARFLAQVSRWQGLLIGFSDAMARNRDKGLEAPVEVGDIFALEDAVGRCKAVLEGL